MNLHTLDYVILLCEDLARMKTFYHEILGFPIVRDREDWIELRLGAVLLILRPKTCSAPQGKAGCLPPCGAPPRHAPAT